MRHVDAQPHDAYVTRLDALTSNELILLVSINPDLSDLYLPTQHPRYQVSVMTNNWRTNIEGVMLFEPSGGVVSNADNATTIEARISHMSIDVDARADSPSTTNGDEPQVILTPTSSINGSDQWFEQLEEYLIDADIPNDLNSTSSSSSSVDDPVSEESDSVLAEPQTPCPRRTANTVLPDSLRDIERGSPPHKWTVGERLTLCVLFRFWEKKDGVDFTKVFNQLCGLELPVRRIKTQFENHLRLYGHKAFPFYGDVFSCPLDDPEDKFLYLRTQLEDTANTLGVILERKTIDNDVVPAGRAARAKARRTRRNYRSLMRRAQTQMATMRTPQAPSSTAPVRIGGFPIPSPQEEAEAHVMSEPEATSEPEFPTSLSSSHEFHQVQYLAFRVWDSDSRTTFTRERGFVSELHSIWRGPTLPPPNPETEDGRNVQRLLSNIHLNKKGNASSYVSVATSVIQVLNYATSKLSDSLQFAVIDLGHASISEKYKQLRAADALKELKSIGQAQWAKYKGTAEIMIWADIPIDAVIFHGSLGDIAAKVTSSPSGRLLLSAEDWMPDQTVYNLTKKLKARHIILDRDLARTCGLFARYIGLATNKATLDHITEFVQCLVDGWSLKCHLMDDIHVRSSIASSFAIGINAQVLMLQDVMTAFIAGVERGVQNIAHFNRRRARPEAENTH